MQNTHPPIPIGFVRDLFATLSGTKAAEIDDADFAAFPEQCQLAPSFGISHGPHDIAQAVDSAWPHPAGAEHVDALVVIRGNDIKMDHYKAIQKKLRQKLHESSTLLIAFNKSDTVPSGTVSLVFLAIASPN